MNYAPRPSRPGRGMDADNTAGQWTHGARARGAYRATRVRLVLVQGWIEGRAAGPDRCVALGRAHEFQGHDQYSPRSGEGHHRAVWRDVERLHLDRSDDVPRDGEPGRTRPDVVHRVGADGPMSVPPRRLCVGAHGHHFRAERWRERSGSIPRSRGDGHRVQDTSLSTPDDWVARGSGSDDARGP